MRTLWERSAAGAFRFPRAFRAAFPLAREARSRRGPLPVNPDPREPPSPSASGPHPEPVVGVVPWREGGEANGLLEALETRTEPAPALRVGGMRGKVALVTGASRGLGRAIALEFARAGAQVAFNFLDTGPESLEEAEETARDLAAEGVRVFWRACDVRSSEEVNRFVQGVVEELGGLHFLVNNAGVGRDRALWRMSDGDWNAVLDTNLRGAFYFLRAAAPVLRAQEWGKIVNVASVHGLGAEFGLANYSASKAGLIALTRTAAVELGPKNINVNAVAPGYIRTTRLTEQVPAEILDRARERSALKRLGDPRDVAQVVLFLCSEAARHITGAVIPIDGGYLL